ncbi:hypothetical protein MKX01_030626 [Papaver californicum]|nr:hypothetical protein MKX01_030626 [Papaver californicum]
MAPNLKPKPIEIREVWSDNLYKEFYRISNALFEFPIVSMDTEFLGVIYHPTRGNFIPDRTLVYFLRPVSNYQAVVKVYGHPTQNQLAMSNLSDLGTDTCYIWQFNFRDFDISNDYYAPDSIELLKRHGIDFEKNRQEGIDSMMFADLLFRSRLVCNGSLAWVTFHSAYDFGYLIKILTKKTLPYEHIMKFCNNFYGGLERVAKTLEVDREVGNRHQASSGWI